MTLTKTKKTALMTEFGIHAKDTGSAKVQVALLTARINELTGHFKTHKKDHGSRHGLLKLVGNRRRLLDYLKLTDEKGYSEVIKQLDLRK
ncbi:MAG: 30S ribosomal protein S15 [Candidatus Omnitrophota bacterium]